MYAVRKRRGPQQAHARAELETSSKEHSHDKETPQRPNTTQADSQHARLRADLLAEFRFAVLRSIRSASEIKMIGVGLMNNRITMPQAISLLVTSDDLEWLSLEGGLDHG